MKLFSYKFYYDKSNRKDQYYIVSFWTAYLFVYFLYFSCMHVVMWCVQLLRVTWIKSWMCTSPQRHISTPLSYLELGIVIRTCIWLLNLFYTHCCIRFCYWLTPERSPSVFISVTMSIKLSDGAVFSMYSVVILIRHRLNTDPRIEGSLSDTSRWRRIMIQSTSMI